MFVHDLLKPRTNAICELKVPDGYELTMSWKHVLATGNFGSRLLVRVSANGEDSHDDLLIFDLKSAAILEKYACRVDKYEVAADWEASKKRYNVQETMDAFVSRCINERSALFCFSSESLFRFAVKVFKKCKVHFSCFCFASCRFSSEAETCNFRIFRNRDRTTEAENSKEEILRHFLEISQIFYFQKSSSFSINSGSSSGNFRE